MGRFADYTEMKLFEPSRRLLVSENFCKGKMGQCPALLQSRSSVCCSQPGMPLSSCPAWPGTRQEGLRKPARSTGSSGLPSGQRASLSPMEGLGESPRQLEQSCSERGERGCDCSLAQGQSQLHAWASRALPGAAAMARICCPQHLCQSPQQPGWLCCSPARSRRCLQGNSPSGVESSSSAPAASLLAWQQQQEMQISPYPAVPSWLCPVHTPHPDKKETAPFNHFPQLVQAVFRY